jgi:hypothetical protein
MYGLRSKGVTVLGAAINVAKIRTAFILSFDIRRVDNTVARTFDLLRPDYKPNRTTNATDIMWVKFILSRKDICNSGVSCITPYMNEQIDRRGISGILFL